MQQVNLYLPEFRPQRVWFSLSHILLATAGVLVIIVALSVWSYSWTARQQAELESERQQLAEQRESLARLQAQLPASAGRGRAEGLREDIQRREQLLAVMTRQNLGNADGFSEQMVALSERLPEGLALSRFAFLDGGKYVELSGRVHEPQSVPYYLQQLREEAAFATVRFGVLEVAREEDSGQVGLSFNVARSDSTEQRREGER